MGAVTPLPFIAGAVRASARTHYRCAALAEAANLVQNGDALSDHARRAEISAYLLDVLAEISTAAAAGIDNLY